MKKISFPLLVLALFFIGCSKPDDVSFVFYSQTSGLVNDFDFTSDGHFLVTIRNTVDFYENTGENFEIVKSVEFPDIVESDEGKFFNMILAPKTNFIHMFGRLLYPYHVNVKGYDFTLQSDEDRGFFCVSCDGNYLFKTYATGGTNYWGFSSYDYGIELIYISPDTMIWLPGKSLPSTVSYISHSNVCDIYALAIVDTTFLYQINFDNYSWRLLQKIQGGFVSFMSHNGDILVNFEEPKMRIYKLQADGTFELSKKIKLKDWIRTGDFSPDDKFLAIGFYYENFVRIFYNNDGSFSQYTDLEIGEPVMKLKFSPDNKWLLILTNTRKLLFYKMVEEVN